MGAQEIIDMLAMKRHPEGGWYSETFRDSEGGSGGHSTAIYYLLEAGDRSHWHRVFGSAEVWHHYDGDALELSISSDGKTSQTHILGKDLQTGQRPQIVVRPNEWQSARPLGDWTLVGCTVAPGFEFANFEMAPSGWMPGQT